MLSMSIILLEVLFQAYESYTYEEDPHAGEDLDAWLSHDHRLLSPRRQLTHFAACTEP